MVSKLYGVNPTIIIFVIFFVLYPYNRLMSSKEAPKVLHSGGLLSRGAKFRFRLVFSFFSFFFNFKFISDFLFFFFTILKFLWSFQWQVSFGDEQ